MTQYLPSHGEQLLFATAAGPDAWKTARSDCENQRTSQQKTHTFSPVVMYVLIRTQPATDTNQVSMDLVLYPCTRKHECRNVFLLGKDFMKEQNQTMAICGQCLIGSWIVYLYAHPWLAMLHSLPDYAQPSDASFHVFGSSIPIFCVSFNVVFKNQLYTTCSLYEWKQTWHLQIKKNFFQVWLLYGYCIIGLVSMLKSEWGCLTHVNPYKKMVASH